MPDSDDRRIVRAMRPSPNRPHSASCPANQIFAVAELTADLAADVLAACRQSTAETAEALARALDMTPTIEVGEASTYDPAEPLADLQGPGLVIALLIGGRAALVAMSEASGLLPAWYKSPDATGESKLMTLAQELGMLLIPESHMPEDFKAGRVGDLAAALARCELPAPAGYVPLALQSGDAAGTLHLLWPAVAPEAIFADAKPSGEPTAEPQAAAPASPVAPPVQVESEDDPFRRLPHYTQSLLRVGLLVRVRLAQKPQRVDDITTLGPGQIIQFDKPCDDMLDLLVGHQHVARGEAVKVGDKFGLRITSIALPEERFRKVG
jgi:flagellar motor switch/type III secretory pathway protein FliN